MAETEEWREKNTKGERTPHGGRQNPEKKNLRGEELQPAEKNEMLQANTIPEEANNKDRKGRQRKQKGGQSRLRD